MRMIRILISRVPNGGRDRKGNKWRSALRFELEYCSKIEFPPCNEGEEIEGGEGGEGGKGVVMLA